MRRCILCRGAGGFVCKVRLGRTGKIVREKRECAVCAGTGSARSRDLGAGRDG